MEPDIYQIVSINSEGQRVEVFALPSTRRMIQRDMAEDYGNVEVTGMSFDELPQEVRDQISGSNIAAGE